MENRSITYKAVCATLVIIVGFFCTSLYNKMNELQKDLIQIQVQLVSVQAKIITHDAVKEIVQAEIYKYHQRTAS